jgi:seryl-tRNA synthetase
VKKEAMITTGFLPNDASNLYRVNPKCPVEQTEWEEDDLYLIGTAEVALVSQHMDEVLSADDLPLRYVGFSACFRREA